MSKDFANQAPLPERINDGLKRVAAVMRSDEWSAAQSIGLTATQLQILAYLAGRSGGARVTEIAAHLGVSQPTATDSVNALQRKEYVAKTVQADRRSAAVAITADGKATLHQANKAGNATREALAGLGRQEQEELLHSLVKVISGLQEAGAIPVQRMCSNCKYFQPHAHPGKDKPHHCQFVNAPMRHRDFRVDCREHETAEPEARAATWALLQAG